MLHTEIMDECNLIFVDCEGYGPAPTLNDDSKFEFGAVGACGDEGEFLGFYCLEEVESYQARSRSSAPFALENATGIYPSRLI